MESNRTICYTDQQGKSKTLTTTTCVVGELKNASHVNIIRCLKSGLTTIEATNNNNFQYKRDQVSESLLGVKLEHSYACPAHILQLNNPNKPLRLCCCILLKSGNRCLATKRSNNISFPGAWVLPGGGVEDKQTIFQAGLRECFEEVGRPFNLNELESLGSNNVMVWESHYVKDNTIHRGNFVVFITIPTEFFQVKVQQSEVEQYKWIDIRQASVCPIYNEKQRLGFGEGHIRYLKMISAGMLNESL